MSKVTFCSCHQNLNSYISVLYAPDLGPTGLDIAKLASRFEVYKKENALGDGHSEKMMLKNMDDVIPFYPEIVCYKVFSITVG